MENNENNTPQAPQISESEMKLPEEQFGTQAATAPAPKHAINPLLIVLLVVLLALLGAVIFWGEEIIGFFMPDTTVELPPLPEEEQPSTFEAEAAEMETELDEAELEEFDAEMAAIEAEMKAELEAE